MRKALILLAAIVAAVLALATPAMAWEQSAIVVSGYAECQDGAWHIQWTVTNTTDANIRLTGSTRPNIVPPDALIGANMGDYFAEVLPGSTTGAVDLGVTWDGGNMTADVELHGTCTPTPTSPPPTTPPPTSPPPTTTPPPTGTHTTPPATTYTPPPELAMTGGNVTGPAVAFVILLAVGLGLLWLTRKHAEEKP